MPPHKRVDAAYCDDKCRNAAEKARYCARNPDYVTRQRRAVAELHHIKTHGHTKYLDNPIGNPKDKYRVARSLGFRSMLEVNVSRQLTAAGYEFGYETITIPYFKEAIDVS